MDHLTKQQLQQQTNQIAALSTLLTDLAAILAEIAPAKVDALLLRQRMIVQAIECGTYVNADEHLLDGHRLMRDVLESARSTNNDTNRSQALQTV